MLSSMRMKSKLFLDTPGLSCEPAQTVIQAGLESTSKEEEALQLSSLNTHLLGDNWE